jgi:hypothetical protein
MNTSYTVNLTPPRKDKYSSSCTAQVIDKARQMVTKTLDNDLN